MISQITQIAKIDALLGKLSAKRFNALLPVNIEVLKEEPQPQRYLLKVGHRELHTQSAKPLDVGAKYWGAMQEDAQKHTISLSKLLQKPKLLQSRQMHAFLPEFTLQRVATLLSKESPKVEMKLLLLEHLAQTGSKQEFLTLTNMIAALNTGLFTMLLKYQNKKSLFQFRKRKIQSETSNENGMIDFYAAFEHLGPLEGIIEISKEGRRLTLYLQYEESLAFLSRELESLDFEGRLLPKEGEVRPLYEPVSSLLDIKG